MEQKKKNLATQVNGRGARVWKISWLVVSFIVVAAFVLVLRIKDWEMGSADAGNQIAERQDSFEDLGLPQEEERISSIGQAPRRKTNLEASNSEETVQDAISMDLEDAEERLEAYYVHGYVLWTEGEKLANAGELDAAKEKLSHARSYFDAIGTHRTDWKPSLMEYRSRRTKEYLAAIDVVLEEQVQPNEVPAE
ncbi:MAG: hypothetical protein AAGJ79_15575 [Verrucomicrobiota bacterium]